MKTYPLNYYWLWTSEHWTWQPVSQQQIDATTAAANALNAPFALATCEWVLGPPQLPTQRTSRAPREDLRLRMMLLAKAEPKAVDLCWRPLGIGEFQIVPFQHGRRGVYTAVLPATAVGNDDLEYHVKVEMADGQSIYYPANAPTMNHTIVIAP